MFTPISRAISSASVVLPSPGGPKNSVWSSGSLRCVAASMAIRSASLTFPWPMNSARLEGRSATSPTRSSARASGVVISGRARAPYFPVGRDVHRTGRASASMRCFAWQVTHASSVRVTVAGTSFRLVEPQRVQIHSAVVISSAAVVMVTCW